MTSETELSHERLQAAWPSKVLVPRLTGFCEGVRRSVTSYEEALDSLESGEVLYSIGEPAHNDRLNQRFKDRGVIFVDHVSEVPPGSKARLGPHGSTDEDIKIAQANGLEFANTVCPLVTKPLKEIKNYNKAGITTFYHGYIEGNGELHPETRAALAAGGENIVLVISNKEDFTEEVIERIPVLVISREELLSEDVVQKIPDPEKVAFVSQTTHNADEETKIKNAIKIILPKITLPSVGDVCYATRNRQKALVEMINKGARRIIILGSKHSKNAKNMVKVSTDIGVDVFFVNGADSLDPADFYGSGSTVGITGAASTEDMTIQEAVRFFTERGSEGPEIVELFDEQGKLITEERITFQPPKIVRTSA